MKKTARRPKNDFKKTKSMSQNLSPPEKKHWPMKHKKVIIILVVAIRFYCEKKKRKGRKKNFHIRH